MLYLLKKKRIQLNLQKVFRDKKQLLERDV